MTVRRYRDTDWDAWLRMSLALFPHATVADLAPSMRAFLTRGDAAVFVAERPDGSVCGFVEVGARPYADGCDTSPVGYIEAWWVDADQRRQGYGRALLRAAEEWASTRGYREMASDALIDNTVSYAAHVRSGYEEVERVVQFRKPLDLAPIARPSPEANAKEREQRVQVRLATLDDRDFIVALVPRLRAFGDVPLRSPDALDRAEREALETALIAPKADSVVYVAEQSGAPVGVVYVETATDYFTRERHGHLAILAVSDVAEGRGVGRALIDAATDWARARGYRFMTLNAFAGNVRARAVYERAGFAIDTVRYIKEL